MVGVAVVMVLTVANLALWDDAWLAAKSDRTRRVKVFTMSGVQIGKPGIGESHERLTFPMGYLVGDALAGTQWIRFATDAEMKTDTRWWRVSECQPRTLIHCRVSDVGTDMVAAADHPMGLNGCLMQALAQNPHDA